MAKSDLKKKIDAEKLRDFEEELERHNALCEYAREKGYTIAVSPDDEGEDDE
jgi:hypothetical protein